MKNYTAADFGPNGEAVAALIEAARNLTSDQVTELGAVWRDIGKSAPNAAWDAAWMATRGTAWATARGAVRGSVRDAVRDEIWYASQGSAWNYLTRYAVLDATIALATQDLISEEHFNTLYGPWSSVMEAGK